jgi:hypothetical protein
MSREQQGEKQISYSPQRAKALAGDPDCGNDKKTTGKMGGG